MRFYIHIYKRNCIKFVSDKLEVHIDEYILKNI